MSFVAPLCLVLVSTLLLHPWYFTGKHQTVRRNTPLKCSWWHVTLPCVLQSGISDLKVSPANKQRQYCAGRPTSSSGVLMSMCSNTMNSFFTLTGSSHGRCSSAFTQYLTLPCFPSKEVARALTDEMKGSIDLEGVRVVCGSAPTAVSPRRFKCS